MVNTEAIRNAVGKLAVEFDPERIILFGSQARGDADLHSMSICWSYPPFAATAGR